MVPSLPGLAQTIEFRRFADGCQRTFLCGDRDIDGWFRTKARKAHERLLCQVETAHLPGNAQALGFYSLRLALEPETLLLKSERSFFPLYKSVFPTVQLEWLAVAKSMQRQGVGTVIMGRVLDRYYQIVRTLGDLPLTLVAANEEAKKFYTSLGFAPYGQGAGLPRLLLPAQSVIELIENRPKP